MNTDPSDGPGPSATTTGADLRTLIKETLLEVLHENPSILAPPTNRARDTPPAGDAPHSEEDGK